MVERVIGLPAGADPVSRPSGRKRRLVLRVSPKAPRADAYSSSSDWTSSRVKSGLPRCFSPESFSRGEGARSEQPPQQILLFGDLLFQLDQLAGSAPVRRPGARPGCLPSVRGPGGGHRGDHALDRASLQGASRCHITPKPKKAGTTASWMPGRSARGSPRSRSSCRSSPRLPRRRLQTKGRPHSAVP